MTHLLLDLALSPTDTPPNRKFAGVPTYQGMVCAWECDDIGHMNVQFYVAKADEAARLFFLMHGLDHRHLEDYDLSISSRTTHCRYHKELRSGALISGKTHVIEAKADQLVLCHVLSDGAVDEIAATLVVRYDLQNSAGQTVPWSDAHCAAFARVKADLPEAAHARSIAQVEAPAPLTLEASLELPLFDIYQGMVQTEQCDTQGFMRPQFLMSRISDGAGHLWQKAGFDRYRLMEENLGTVVLETRIDFYQPITAGQGLSVRSALLAVSGRTLHFRHFVFDLASGVQVGGGEVVALLIDMEARKSVPLTSEDIERLTPHVVTLSAQ
ncbi:MAG: thioesterase family protein [Parvibaculaceae bacterium]|nr:thioesterase family protein [Parvibaculaceae bacterium]